LDNFDKSPDLLMEMMAQIKNNGTILDNKVSQMSSQVNQ
jgi:hypothetical protein